MNVPKVAFEQWEQRKSTSTTFLFLNGFLLQHIGSKNVHVLQRGYNLFTHFILS